jgi:CubicO group peptidase (beta-lactamase class C family)
MPRIGPAVGLFLIATSRGAAQARELTAEDVGSWLDGYLGGALARAHLAGAVVVVVKDGKVLVERGYGWADVAARRPMSPESTVVRAASISKLFTTTAVMQLVDRGALDLDADVNRYLDFTLPPTFGQPVLVRNLLTHSAGFADVQKGSSPRDPRYFRPLDQYLATHLPRRAFPRDRVPGYSNYGFALAADVVQRVSGLPFEDYLDREVLGPLGMSRTTCRQPIPEPFRSAMSGVYPIATDSPKPIEITVWRGAGCIVTTAADMARFMVAHLHDGRFPGGALFSPAAARSMHSRAFGPVPHVNGMALGFFQEDRNGHRIIGHDGDFGFHSDLHLYLDQDVGYFVSFNGDGTNTAVYQIREGLFDEFTDRYFPGGPDPEVATTTGADHARRSAGSYESSRRLTGPLSLFMLFNQVRVTAGPDGTLSIPVPPAGEARRYREVGPYFWREIGGPGRVEMTLDGDRVTAFFDHPVGGFIRVPWWKSARFNLPLLAGAIVVFLVLVIAWPVTALVRRAHQRRLFPLAGREAVAYRLARVAAIFHLLFLLGWGIVAANLLSHFYLFNEGIDPWFRLLHLVGAIAIIGTLAAFASARFSWKYRRPWVSRLAASLLLSACLVVTWLTVTFNLITLDLSY